MRPPNCWGRWAPFGVGVPRRGGSEAGCAVWMTKATIRRARPGSWSVGVLDKGSLARGGANVEAPAQGARGIPSAPSPSRTQVQALLQEQKPHRAPSGRFLRAWVSPKNPQNLTGGVSVWVAVTLKGCCNRTLQAGQPCPHLGRQGWSSCGTYLGVGEASISRSPRAQFSPLPASLHLGPPGLVPHFSEVETEAQRRSGIP